MQVFEGPTTPKELVALLQKFQAIGDRAFGDLGHALTTADLSKYDRALNFPGRADQLSRE